MNSKKIAIATATGLAITTSATAGFIGGPSFADVESSLGSVTGLDDFQSYPQSGNSCSTQPDKPCPFTFLDSNVNFSSTVGAPAFRIALNSTVGTMSISDDAEYLPFGAVQKALVVDSPSGVTITFAQAVSGFAVHLGGAQFPWTLTAKDASGNVIDKGVYADPTPANTNDNFNFVIGWTGGAVKTVVLGTELGSGDPMLLENLRWTAASNAPEPATALLLLAGLGAIGLMRRRTSPDCFARTPLGAAGTD
ncbi:MAG: PEP-CTERM sorting domain-containing protein [Burkholderiaceae bacterium]